MFISYKLDLPQERSGMVHAGFYFSITEMMFYLCPLVALFVWLISWKIHG